MPPFMHAYAQHAYALMRIVPGFLFLWHGTQKLLSVPMPPPPQIPSFVINVITILGILRPTFTIAT